MLRSSEKLEENLNHGYASLITNSLPNNPNVIMNQTVLHNSDPSVKIPHGFYTLGSIKPQYVGGSSVNNDARTNMFSNVISNNLDFDGLLQFVVHSSSQNIDRQQSTNQEGQYRSSAQRSNCETHRQRRVIRSAPSHQAQQIPLQSNGYKIKLLNTWTPVQARPRVAEESMSHDCDGLSCNICDSAAFSLESRKRKQSFNSSRNESWVGSGTLMDMIPVQPNGFKIQRTDSWKPVQSRPRVSEQISSHNCYGLTCDLCGPTSFCTESRKRKYPYEPRSYESDSDNGTLMDVLNGFLNSYVPDRVSQELSSAMSEQPLYGRLPPLEQYSDKNEDVSVVKTQLSDDASSSKVINIITKDAPFFEENTNDRKGESSQVRSKVIICNTFAELLTSVNTSIEAEDLMFNEMPNLEQWSNSSEDVTMDSSPNNPSAEPKGPPKLRFEQKTSDKKAESSQVSSEVNICSTFTDLLSSSYVNTSVEAEDLVFPEMPNLEQRSNSSEDVIMVSSPTGNNLLKDNDDTTSDKLKEPPKLNFEEKTSDEKVESSQVNLNVKCGFNTTADDYESLLESMQSLTPTSVLESDHTKLDTKSFDDKSGNIKCPSASLANSFTVSQIKEHLSSFIQPNKEITPSSSQNTCQLCSMDKLPLAPPPMYCSACDLRIRQNVGYYRLKDEKATTQHSICQKCFKGAYVCIKLIHGGSVSKTNLKPTKNDEEREDSWVQCDRCQQWQHRICGLYNDETDTEGKAEYVCPKCYLKELENGTGIPLTKNVLGAKDLPRTNLSDHIEQRLFRRLKQEREETAKLHGIELEKVPEAEGLVVRVVVSDDKELEVRQQFRDIFHGENYPEKMPFRSKLILLFQRTGGVDLCLFGMYVQEFGLDCDGPSKRCVYISYLDSVKYFQPERKTTCTGSLRTFVYHEVLIGYMEYCKKIGFATCYIYSCPLIKGDDYIFYCHPNTQKTPEKRKLRQWYKSMLSKATKEGIVVGETNLYNQFFVPTKEGNMKISASRLPYFDGDTWSAAAIETSKELEEEEKSEKLCVKLPTKRMLMSMGQDNPSKDALVMQRLGTKILREKENLMVVWLQHMCTYCHEPILSGSRWSCNQCNKIHLCSRCYDNDKLLSGKKMHTCRSDKKCLLSEYVFSEVPLDTNNKDDVLVNNFFKTRDDFLNKCQKSQYHFDTLGHAKYSSMMILYRLLT